MLTYLPPVTQVVLVLIVLTAGIYDLRYRRIPNWLVLVGLVLGFGLNTFLFGVSGLERSATIRLHRAHPRHHPATNTSSGGLPRCLPCSPSCFSQSLRFS